MSNDDIENEFDTDDFDTGDFDDGGFDDLNSQKGTLGDLWRNNPLVKIGVILAAFAFLVGGIILFGGKRDNLPESRVASSRDITEAPGSAETTETFRQAIEEENVRRIEEAQRSATSAVPTPVDPPKGTLPLQFEEPEEEDPLERWRRMQEDRIRQQQVEVQLENEPEAPPPPDTRTPAINALAQAMSQQMESVLSNQQIKPPILQNVATLSYLEALQEKERKKLEEALASQQAAFGAIDPDEVNILLSAGTIEYAQLITEANTDAPGPILAQIVTGPLKGGRLIGSFTSTDKYLTLNFNTIVLDGIDYAAQGIAIDPNTTLPGVVTEIDHRYFTKIVLPAAAAFVTGLTTAIADSGKTTIVIQNSDGSSSTTTSGTNDSDQEVASGIAEAGDVIADILNEKADNTQTLIRVAPGTPIGVLFISPVVDTPQLLQRQQQQQVQQPYPYDQTTTAPATTNPFSSIPSTINVLTP
ncbi:MAG TPA: TrbI/VirB10 family protein [Alphaproteobacteria bacterium]|nr:TrbI/VirB10 family protein [Alphaproteobacteria bacterium]